MAEDATTIGLVGPGLVGQSMALNLAQTCMPPIVWSRTAAHRELAGAESQVRDSAMIFNATSLALASSQ
jgi:3-hydroxyisobutyrate dehydrogenase-like beta-hydroxyacid dehydrogenase